MSHTFIKKILVLSAVSFFVGGVADSQTNPTEEELSCYQIEMPTTAKELGAENSYETWCYQKLESPEGAIFVFNADSSEIQNELSFIIEPEGTLVHASLLLGQLTTHRVWAHQYNPFSVPIKEPTHLEKIPLPVSRYSTLMQSAEMVLQFLAQRTSPPMDMSIQPGTFADSVSDAAKPWRGYWWPRNGQPLSNGLNSPLGKYDRYVKARTGTNPGARSWENTYHNYKGVKWEGHCNGWAASSVLRPQPLTSQYDSLSGVSFTVSDQKGLLAIMDYCTSVAFFGERYRNSSDDINDIYPALFHKTLTYYIGQLGKPVAVDYFRKGVVDNHIISGYEMDVQYLGNNRYSVTAELKVHGYDKSRINTPGKAPEYIRTYSYYLTTDSSGNPVSGSWKSTNPDFLWVPLSVKDCSRNNPQVTENWIQEIIY